MRTQFNPSPNVTWHTYHVQYLRWMQRTNDPALRSSNYHADKLKESLTKQTQ